MFIDYILFKLDRNSVQCIYNSIDLYTALTSANQDNASSPGRVNGSFLVALAVMYWK
jgi:hypothetical protein